MNVTEKKLIKGLGMVSKKDKWDHRYGFKITKLY